MKTQYLDTVKGDDLRNCWTVTCTRTFNRTADYYRPLEKTSCIRRPETSWRHPHKSRTSKKATWVLQRFSGQRSISDEFSRLTENWKRETGHYSTLFHKVNNINYLRIIGMGYKAVPLILQDLAISPGHWHVALNAITNVNPVPRDQMNNLNAVRESWLAWGRQRNLI